MDEYPPYSLDQAVPLLFTLGVAAASQLAPPGRIDAALRDQAVLIRTEIAPLETEQANVLLRYVHERDADAAAAAAAAAADEPLPWHNRDPTRRYRLRIRTAGREFLLPPREAKLPENMEPPSTSPTTHSPFSPLSPASSLYPDGLIGTTWLRKHLELIPSVLLCFYGLTSDPTLAAVHDNMIKTDLNKIRALLTQSGYRTRLAVVVMPKQPSPSVEGLPDRLENIRRACGLDPKAFFTVPPSGSQAELERMAENMLTTLYALAVEYYRDLGRHARKKRSRGVAPQPSIRPTIGTSYSLSLAGWNVRYDFKSAVFAEYRQEMDLALRSFEQAYENVMSSDILEAIPNWSPRWNEARFLLDIIAVRHLRCLLWLGQHTSAVRKWRSHRDRIADCVERHGRGTSNYGWSAWEARWTLVMANLVEQAQVAELLPSGHPFLPPEKSVKGERLQPWDLLHPPGYWYRLASKHVNARRLYAYAMPEDDRRAPSASPASQVAIRAFAYDTYMCPDPHEEMPLRGGNGVDHGRIIVDCLLKARHESVQRQQSRLVGEIALECAKELLAAQDWAHVLELLRPLWATREFRREGWLDVAEDLCWTLRAAAAKTNEADLLIAIDWELLDGQFRRRPGWHYDLGKSLVDIEAKTTTTTVRIDSDTTCSFLAPSFVFRREEGRAGQTAQAQLSIRSSAHHHSAPIVLDSLRIEFQGGSSIQAVKLQHAPDADPSEHRTSSVIKSTVTLREAITSEPAEPDASGVASPLVGTADLTLLPGHTMVFELEIHLREPGESIAAAVTLSLRSESFDLDHVSTFTEPRNSPLWFLSPSAKTRVAHSCPLALRILPRPPKMDIRELVLLSQYYANEPIDLAFEIRNAEAVDALVQIDAVLLGDEDPPPLALTVAGRDEAHVSSALDNEERRLLGVGLGSLASGKAVSIGIRLQPVDRTSRYDLTLRAVYHLATDLQTPITQTAVFSINVATPFEANYDLLPRLNSDPWPSLFDASGLQDLSGHRDASVVPQGISQTWCLLTRYASLAAEELHIVDLDISVQQDAGSAAQYRVVKKHGLPEAGRRLGPKTIEEAAFDIIAQKHLLDDRSPSPLDASLLIKWTRPARCAQDAAAGEHVTTTDPPKPPINTTVVTVPRFHLFGIEPRVLASVSYLPGGKSEAGEDTGQAPRLRRHSPAVVLDVVLENASNHFLTFGVSLEPSAEFAFSGPKQTTLHVLPVSRRAVAYRLLPLVRGAWIRPALVVRDKHFQKVLAVIPTTEEGMRLDKDGFSVWVPPLEDEEDERQDEAKA